jgi:hypothetical protein
VSIAGVLQARSSAGQQSSRLTSFRDLITRVQARVAQFRQEIIPGTTLGDTINILRLICPLRYDLRVRIDFIRLLRDNWSLYTNDLSRFLERPESKAYSVWFRDVRCARYRPELLADDQRLGAAFTDRVRQTAALWQSIQRDGYDRSRPIRLEAGHSIRNTNGKHVNSRYFTGDGCHRMASLYLSGHTRLEPSDYEVRYHRDFEPLDITAELVTLLRLDRQTYLDFLSTFYCDGVHLDSAEQIVRHVSAYRPELLSEVESVLAFDLPRLQA